MFPQAEVVVNTTTLTYSVEEYVDLPLDLNVVVDDFDHLTNLNLLNLNYLYINYVPTELIDYYLPLEQRFGLRKHFFKYHPGQFKPVYSIDNMVEHVFTLCDHQIKEAKRLNLERPQC